MHSLYKKKNNNNSNNNKDIIIELNYKLNSIEYYIVFFFSSYLAESLSLVIYGLLLHSQTP